MNMKTSIPKDPQTVCASACMGAGMPDGTTEKLFAGTDANLNAAADLRIMGISDLFGALGYPYSPSRENEMHRALRAAFSSANIPNVLSNVAQKFLLAGFGAVGEAWREITKVLPCRNFRRVKSLRLTLGGELEPLGKGGELKHVSLDDEARELAATTSGALIGITREDLVNDDLGVLSEIPTRFGMMAGRTINRAVFDQLSRTASDYGASATGALNLKNLESAYAAASLIRDAEGNPLGAAPNRVLTAPGGGMTAKSIYVSEFITGAQTERGRTNVLRGLLEPITTPYLGTDTDYWLFNDAFPLVDAAFLYGNTTPQVESANADFNQLGIQMRCFYDFGVGPGELKAALYSTGA